MKVSVSLTLVAPIDKGETILHLGRPIKSYPEKLVRDISTANMDTASPFMESGKDYGGFMLPETS